MAAASPIAIQRPHHQHRSSGSFNGINMNHVPQQAQGQGPYRMSFSPNEREYQGPPHPQQSAYPPNDSTYTGIVGNTARSIFGSDDENYMQNHPSPLERGYNGDPQQQYLAHERLATIAERATHQGQNGAIHPHHHNGQYTTLVPNRPSLPPFPLEMQAGVGVYAAGAPGIPPSPVAGPSVGAWTNVMSSKRA